MMFTTYFHDERKHWRIRFNDIDICHAINEFVARETALCLTAYRSVFP